MGYRSHSSSGCIPLGGAICVNRALYAPFAVLLRCVDKTCTATGVQWFLTYLININIGIIRYIWHRVYLT